MLMDGVRAGLVGWKGLYVVVACVVVVDVVCLRSRMGGRGKSLMLVDVSWSAK